MTLKLWLCTASFLGPIVVVNSACSPRPSGCQRNNSIYANNTTVYSTSTVNCSFVGSLCCYRQGCFDVNIEQWQTTHGHASVRQTSQGCGNNVYSVLESPWVNFFTPSCVEFTYSRSSPYQLQVFLAFSNGTQPSIMEDSQNVTEYDNQNHTARFNIEHLTGQIQFRVRGGGAGPLVSPPRLYYVRITEGRCLHNASSQHPEVSDPSSCDVLTTTSPTTVHTTSSTNTHLTPPSTAASTSPQPTSTNRRSSDMSTGSLVAILVFVIVGVVVVVVVIVLIVRRRRRRQRDQKPERSGSDGPRGQAVYENQGFHDQTARHPVVVSSSGSVNPRDMSYPRDPAIPPDSIDYLMPLNVYDSLANRNIEQNPYDALANQNNTYEGLSQNRNENRTYESLVASRGQNEDYEIPDTTSNNDTRLAEVNRNCCEYNNQPRLKKSGISSPSQAVSLSQVSEYQNIKT